VHRRHTRMPGWGLKKWVLTYDPFCMSNLISWGQFKASAKYDRILGMLKYFAEQHSFNMVCFWEKKQ